MDFKYSGIVISKRDLSETDRIYNFYSKEEGKIQAVGRGVKVEKRKDGLYVDDRKVILYLSERQKNGQKIRGYVLREEVSGKLVLHPNILDALLEH